MKAKDKCKKIVEEANLLGYEHDITEGQLTNIVMNKLGVIDKRAVQNWINALLVFSYLEVKAPHVYTIKQ